MASPAPSLGRPPIRRSINQADAEEEERDHSEGSRSSQWSSHLSHYWTTYQGDCEARMATQSECAELSSRPIGSLTSIHSQDMAKRVYTCPFEGCDRIFGRPSARETHIRSHNGIQPFTCPICARPFSVFSNLKRHMIVHPTVDFRSVSVGDLPHIHCRETEVGPILEWDDQEPERVRGKEEMGEEMDELTEG